MDSKAVKNMGYFFDADDALSMAKVKLEILKEDQASEVYQSLIQKVMMHK